MVRCERLDAILQHEDVTKVDSLSLDVEGRRTRSCRRWLGSIHPSIHSASQPARWASYS